MTTPQPQIGQSSSKFWTYAALLRVPNIFTAVADVTMGFLFTHAAFGRGDAWVFALLVGASSALYGSGVVLNDVFDLEIDSRQRPHRPLPSGRISVASARWLGWELLLLGTALAWLAAFLANDFRPGVVATLLAGCVVLYNGVVKRTLLGPLAMGGCRALNVLLGMSVAAGPWRDEHRLAAVAIGTYIVGVTWFARTEADRSSRWHLGLASVVILGGIGLLWHLPQRCDAIVPLLKQEPARWNLLMGVLALLIGMRTFRAVLDPTPYRVQMAVGQCILWLVFLDAAACLVVRGASGAMMVLVLLIPTVLLGRWVEST